MDSIVRFALAAKGISEPTIEAIDRLLGLETQLEPIIQKNLPHLRAMSPDLSAIEKIVKQAWPDLVLAAPAIINLIKGN